MNNKSQDLWLVTRNIATLKIKAKIKKRVTIKNKYIKSKKKYKK